MIRPGSVPYRRPATLSLPGFGVAVVGTFIGFLPLIQILLPLKAATIGAGGATMLLGMTVAIGAAAAGIANIAIGWLSDRTRSRFGRRRPWIVAGAAGVVLSYAMIMAARSASQLVGGFVLFQLALNMIFAPLLALVPDRVPEHERGRAAALMGLGAPLGTLLGSILIGAAVTRESIRFAALAIVVLVSTVPFALALGPDPPRVSRPPQADRRAARPKGPRDFLLGCLSRLCLLLAPAIVQVYMLLYIQTLIPAGAPHAAERGMSLLGALYGVLSGIAGLAGGWASDRLRRRKAFVIGAALLVCMGMLGLAAAPSFSAAMLAYAVLAMGTGIHTAVEFAMIVDILPSRDRAGRDLGILNLANIAPQVVAPLGVSELLAAGGTLHEAFAIVGVVAGLSAGLVALMRTVR